MKKTSSKSNKKRNPSEERHLTATKLKLYEPIFLQKVHTLRDKWKIPQAGLKSKSQELCNWYKNTRTDEFYCDINELMKNKFSDYWRIVIQKFVIFNKVSKIMPIQVKLSNNWLTGKREVSLVVEDYATLEDFKSLMITINGLQAGILNRSRLKIEPQKNLDRNREIFELRRRDGRSYREIQDIIKEKYGEDISYYELKKIVQNYGKMGEES